MHGFLVTPFQGLPSIFTLVPRALPWAVLLPPLRGCTPLDRCANFRREAPLRLQGHSNAQYGNEQESRSTAERLEFLLVGPKGRNMKAQGNALGQACSKRCSALKGRDNVSIPDKLPCTDSLLRPFRACSPLSLLFPGRCPGLSYCRPFVAVYCARNVLFLGSRQECPLPWAVLLPPLRGCKLRKKCAVSREQTGVPVAPGCPVADPSAL